MHLTSGGMFTGAGVGVLMHHAAGARPHPSVNGQGETVVLLVSNKRACKVMMKLTLCRMPLVSGTKEVIGGYLMYQSDKHKRYKKAGCPFVILSRVCPLKPHGTGSCRNDVLNPALPGYQTCTQVHIQLACC